MLIVVVVDVVGFPFVFGVVAIALQGLEQSGDGIGGGGLAAG